MSGRPEPARPAAGRPVRTWPAAAAILAERDPVMHRLVAEAGPPHVRPPAETHFEALARAIVYQQLAGAAAAAIHGRLIAALDGEVGAERLLALPDHLVLYPSHYSGSVCGRGLSANPISTVGFERRHNPALQLDSEEAFVEALVRDIPPAPADQAAIVAANRAGRRLTTR